MHARWHHHSETPGAEHVRRIRQRFSTPELARLLAMGEPLSPAERDRVDRFVAVEVARERHAARARVRPSVPATGVAVVLVRGAVRVKCRSKAEAARRLKVARSTFSYRLGEGETATQAVVRKLGEQMAAPVAPPTDDHDGSDRDL
jgi:hypothetical protein